MKSSTIIGLMYQNKKRVTIGMIVAALAFMFVAAITPQYARAQDGISQGNTFTDDDSSGQSNEASISQSESASETAEASASANNFDGGSSTITQEINQNQETQVGQSNSIEDNDIVTQVNVAVEGPEIDLDDD
jgi:hypothetical protein